MTNPTQSENCERINVLLTESERDLLFNCESVLPSELQAFKTEAAGGSALLTRAELEGLCEYIALMAAQTNDRQLEESLQNLFHRIVQMTAPSAYVRPDSVNKIVECKLSKKQRAILAMLPCLAQELKMKLVNDVTEFSIDEMEDLQDEICMSVVRVRLTSLLGIARVISAAIDLHELGQYLRSLKQVINSPLQEESAEAPRI